MSKFSQWSLSTLFHFRSKVKREPVENHRVTNPYHAVSVVPGNNPCMAAKQCVGQRFLSREAPPLPLPDCDRVHCDCRFKHHQDRRIGPRRRGESGLSTSSFGGTERRRSPGRRYDD